MRFRTIITTGALAASLTACTPWNTITVFDDGTYTVTDARVGEDIYIHGCLSEHLACGDWIPEDFPDGPNLVVGGRIIGHPADPAEDDPDFRCNVHGNLRCPWDWTPTGTGPTISIVGLEGRVTLP
jgi:hypothetical protein